MPEPSPLAAMLLADRPLSRLGSVIAPSSHKAAERQPAAKYPGGT
jgi:hypothetical protein